MQLTPASKISWKYSELISALGGPTAVAALLKRRGVAPPPIDTIKGWRQRGSIPGRYAPLMIEIGLEEGVLRSIKSLRERGSDETC